MKLIGLTGGIGTGKSTCSRILQEINQQDPSGVPLQIIDTDLIAREALEPDAAPYKKIVKTFGTQILRQDGTIDREVLGDIVFKNAEARRKINKATHMWIFYQILWRIFKCWLRHRSRVVVVIDAPLLFETKVLARLVSKVILIYADAHTQLDRLMKRNNYNEEEARNRINAQMPIDAKVAMADIVIDNTKSIDDTRRQLVEAYEEIMRSEKQQARKEKVFVASLIIALVTVVVTVTTATATTTTTTLY